jgi:hypothetical protein
MGRSEEPNILGSQFLVNYSFWVKNITDGSKKKMEPRRMKTVIEFMSSKEMGSL